MITVKITLENLPKTNRFLFEADVWSDREPADPRERRAVEAIMPHLREAFRALAKAAADEGATMIEGEGDRGARIAQAVHDARVREERSKQPNPSGQ
jgi:hypothetical protein